MSRVLTVNGERQPDAGLPEDLGTLRRMADEFGLALLTAVSDEMLDPALVDRLPVEWARAHGVLPIRFGGGLAMLTSDPAQVHEQEYLALLLGDDLPPVLAPRALVADSIERCYYSRRESAQEFLDDLDAVPAEGEPAGRATEDLLQVSQEAPISQLINLILLEAVKARASDIHFEPFEARLRIRYRVDGVLYEQASPPKHLEAALVSRLKVMARMDIAEKRLPQDGMARVRVGERQIDVRVSTIPVAEGERVVLRLLDRRSALLPMESLGMSRQVLEAYDGLLAETNGIIVVCGPTGSGKTTTLYGSLGRLDAEHRNIMTIEEPIEYQLPGIGQIQVRPKIGLTFASGLRHILRQDPDVILVGETRDLETAEIAIRASLTGHLVFTTLHTNDAASTVLRLVDMGVAGYLLASSLRAVLAQRLVRCLCEACRREARLPAEQLAGLAGVWRALGEEPVWEPAGCERCLGGYRGRTGLFELMVVDDAIREAIRARRLRLSDIRTCAGQQGMVGMLEDGVGKVRRGITSVAEVVNVLGRMIA